MKRYLLIILVFALALGQACKGPEGEQGPPGPAGANGANGAPGPQGPQGPAGVSDTAQVFDFLAEFTPDDSTGEYSFILPMMGENTPNLELTASDVIIVYTFAGAVDNPDDPNNPFVFWSPLPRRFDLDQGYVTYNYAYSSIALFLFIETQLDLTTLPGATTDRLFRALVIPGKNLGGRTTGKPLTKADLSKYPVDLNDYNAVVKYFKINDKNVRKLSFKK